MGVSYHRLWKLLSDKNMKRIEMQKGIRLWNGDFYWKKEYLDLNMKRENFYVKTEKKLKYNIYIRALTEKSEIDFQLCTDNSGCTYGIWQNNSCKLVSFRMCQRGQALYYTDQCIFG